MLKPGLQSSIAGHGKFASSLDISPRASGSSASTGAIISYGRKQNADRRDQREANADGFHTPEQWLARVVFFGWRCKYCGIQLQEETLTKDHQIALVNGGSEWASNLVPSCKPCNSWKGARRIKVLT